MTGTSSYLSETENRIVYSFINTRPFIFLPYSQFFFLFNKSYFAQKFSFPPQFDRMGYLRSNSGYLIIDITGPNHQCSLSSSKPSVRHKMPIPKSTENVYITTYSKLRDLKSLGVKDVPKTILLEYLFPPGNYSLTHVQVLLKIALSGDSYVDWKDPATVNELNSIITFEKCGKVNGWKVLESNQTVIVENNTRPSNMTWADAKKQLIPVSTLPSSSRSNQNVKDDSRVQRKRSRGSSGSPSRSRSPKSRRYSRTASFDERDRHWDPRYTHRSSRSRSRSRSRDRGGRSTSSRRDTETSRSKSPVQSKQSEGRLSPRNESTSSQQISPQQPEEKVTTNSPYPIRYRPNARSEHLPPVSNNSHSHSPTHQTKEQSTTQPSSDQNIPKPRPSSAPQTPQRSKSTPRLRPHTPTRGSSPPIVNESSKPKPQLVASPAKSNDKSDLYLPSTIIKSEAKPQVPKGSKSPNYSNGVSNDNVPPLPPSLPITESTPSLLNHPLTPFNNMSKDTLTKIVASRIAGYITDWLIEEGICGD